MTTVLGLDLGRVRDYTAAVLLQDDTVNGMERWRPEREDLSDIIPRLEDLAARVPFVLAYDARGIGHPWHQLFMRTPLAFRVPAFAILTTGNNRPPRQLADGRIFVPKLGLIRSLQTALKKGAFRVNPLLPLGPELARELVAFAPSEAGWSAGELHDDLVAAACFATWTRDLLTTGGAGRIQATNVSHLAA